MSLGTGADNDKRGDWFSGSISFSEERSNKYHKNYFTIKSPSGLEWNRQWQCTKEDMEEYLKKDKIYFGAAPEYSNVPRIKIFPEDTDEQIPPNVIDNVSSTRGSQKELDTLFGSRVFDYPKPISLIKRLIQIATNRDDLILDFFAGSGTTMHAVMALNKEDGGNRKCILIQIPEATDPKSEAHKTGYQKISDITIERNKRAIQKLEQDEPSKQASLEQATQKPFEAGFKVYKLEKSNFPRVNFAPDPTKTEKENLKLLDNYIAAKEASLMSELDPRSIFDEVLLKNGFMLNYSKEEEPGFSKNTVYRIKDGSKECLISMDMKIHDEMWQKELQRHKDTFFICLGRALQNTTSKWNLKHLLGEKLITI